MFTRLVTRVHKFFCFYPKLFCLWLQRRFPLPFAPLRPFAHSLLARRLVLVLPVLPRCEPYAQSETHPLHQAVWGPAPQMWVSTCSPIRQWLGAINAPSGFYHKQKATESPCCWFHVFLFSNERKTWCTTFIQLQGKVSLILMEQCLHPWRSSREFWAWVSSRFWKGWKSWNALDFCFSKFVFACSVLVLYSICRISVLLYIVWKFRYFYNFD